MRRPPGEAGSRTRRQRIAILSFTLLPILCHLECACGDEGGASFWVPGQYAVTLSATPPPTGWSIPVTLYYYSGSAPDSALSAQNAAVAPGTRSQTGQLSFSPTYSPRRRMLGGQLALMLSVGAGSNATQVTQSAPLISDSQKVWGFSDVAPAATLGWQKAANSWMVYLTGNVPVGSYESQRLSNMGIGHAAVDAGGGYTYDNPTSRRSVSAALGFTYNLMNPDTSYRSGIDSHIGLSAMLPLSKAWRAGLTSYLYYQLTDDSGSGDSCGPCKSRVAAIGPQLNYAFTVAGQQWSANLRGYYEFWARNRLEGYAIFMTLTVPIGSGKVK